MKATDFAEFCEEGRFGGGEVMVQLKEAGSFLPAVDDAGRVSLAQMDAYAAATQQKGEPLTPEEMAQIGPRFRAIPPIPVIAGKLRIFGELLLLTYEFSGKRYHVTINPDDVKHVSAPESRRIIT